MLAYIIGLIATVVVFSILDFIWLGTVAFSFYESHIGDLLLSSPNWTAGLTFYFMYMIGIYYFVVIPGVKHRSALRGLLNGAIFGFMAYGTYDLTNMATLSGWSWNVVIVDMIWGTFATGLTGFLASLAARRLTAST
ncbi:DUF2177 family protein [Martelella mediterranea]|uniref:Putative membrane protein n=1 Tax=Martelella mediterranea TaxID=293089 RepID=A0A4R3NP71_9HYPH|nr:DUF2177 family protein [Martelella mediterranea]TCT36456.1 putative membrane protein [Martelella mediterranea]